MKIHELQCPEPGWQIIVKPIGHEIPVLNHCAEAKSHSRLMYETSAICSVQFLRWVDGFPYQRVLQPRRKVLRVSKF